MLDDAECLVHNGRYASAKFLLVTGGEELTKVHILLDACRLDFERYESVVRALCKAFYDHIKKHAYAKVHEHPFLRTMADARKVWDLEMVRWWPSSGPESGEPDLPHDTVFDREMPLYVDFGAGHGGWFVPNKGAWAWMFEEEYIVGEPRVQQTGRVLTGLRGVSGAGLFGPDALRILNEVFRSVYISEDTPNEELDRLYESYEEQVRQLLGSDDLPFSVVRRFPLYHFLT